MELLVGFVFLLIIFFVFSDFFIFFALIGLIVGAFMTMTKMIVWEGNSPDINIERGIDYIEQYDAKNPDATSEYDEAARQWRESADDGPVIIYDN